ncbi:MAG: nicotinate-nucleotide adenylyltransferase [Candidatus Eisenbacteria bacterium]|nr:nicotinate-nucleotide adenylyltransferase [Candidatus Eisenbacteria bacterium]
MTAARRPRLAGVRRLGVFGGTFDPPHVGHLALAERAREELRLDRVLFVPAGTPPHKSAARASVAHRLAMTRAAVRGNPAFALSTIETRRAGPSYTADTLAAIARAHPRARLFLLMGADMYATFDSWARPDEIAALATLVVALRPGVKPPRDSRAATRGRGVRRLSNPALEVSSSALRTVAARGRSLRYLVPDAVARYVAKHRLYRRSR